MQIRKFCWCWSEATIIVTLKMAVEGYLFSEFFSQNAFVVMIAVFVTAVVLALSTYYIGRNYMSSTGFEDTSFSQEYNCESPAKQSQTQSVKESSAADSCDSDGNKQETGFTCDQQEESTIDPVYYCEHIQGEIKKVKQDVTTRKICETLSEEQIAEEKQRQRDQLAEIFKLMQEQEEKFGINSMDEIQEQMRLYANF